MFGLDRTELALLKKLSSPEKVQDFLDTVPINFEPEGDTCLSPRRVLRERRAHCIEGAMLAGVTFMLRGEKPLLFDLRSARGDTDHVVALFKKYGKWGAVSKTNHAVLRYREPVYATLRELALSYFHEYFDDTGKKTLREFSARPFDLSRYDPAWITSEEDLWDIPTDLDSARHVSLLAPGQKLRRADVTERKAGEITEWQKPENV